MRDDEEEEERRGDHEGKEGRNVQEEVDRVVEKKKSRESRGEGGNSCTTLVTKCKVHLEVGWGC